MFVEFGDHVRGVQDQIGVRATELLNTRPGRYEIGLDHFEGRTLPGWERHVVLTAIAYGFLQSERRRRGQTHLTLPQVRAVIQEVLTAHFFMTQPHYLEWMLKLKEVELRI